jgi:hypothetical protein
MKGRVLAIFVLAVTSCNTDRNDTVIGLKQNIHHDDFEYSVSDYIITRFLKAGNDTIKAQGAYYLIKFRVENRAMRIDHTWDNSIGYIIDERGNTYENISEVQKFWERINKFGLREQYITRPGTSDSTCLAFDLPFNTTKPYFKVRGSILMGDVFDRAKFRKMRIRLH